MDCLVTAGPTFEPLDQVRRLTNFSSGRLGSELVNFLAAHGHRVTLLIGQQATWRGERNATEVQTFTTTQDLHDRLEAAASRPYHALFHAAAVSDFQFGKIFAKDQSGNLVPLDSGKYPTRTGPLLAELVPTPKIISKLRVWFPQTCIVGWKFEVDGSKPDVIEKANLQIRENQTNACVANGPAYGEGFGLVDAQGKCAHFLNIEFLFEALEKFIETKGAK